VCECAEAGAACGKGRCRENTYKDRQEDLVACIDTHIHSISRTQIIVGFEEPKISRGYCDDGNTVNGDGCSRDCQEECGSAKAPSAATRRAAPSVGTVES